ncbi:hypothetical protein GCM10022226_67740 [Sphaerisporangium flaviroseum]|uniref:Bacterial Ig-like domain-containing protein n=1 Tax=Sphaerisporangium flaviroseum TaxID=509199 RepID=A0ABP7J782_9ACTN
MKYASRPRVGPRHFVRSLLAAALTTTVAMWVVAAAPDSATAAAAPSVNLGAASSFAVLSGGAITNVGGTTVNGDLGVSPALAVVGTPPTVNGAIHIGDPAAAAAQTGLALAYDDVTSRPLTSTIAPALAGQTLTPGVYNTAAPGLFTLTGGTLTLDAQGDPNSVFIIRGAGLTTASTGAISLINGASPCRVFFAMSTAAVTLGTGSTFRGNLLVEPTVAGVVALGFNVTVNGRVLVGRPSALFLSSDTITLPPGCTPPTTGRTTTTTVTTSCSTNGPGGGPLTLTATVRSSGKTVPTGPVVFTADGVSLGAVQLDSNGRATLSPTLTEGIRRIVASFPGTDPLNPSASSEFLLRVGPNGSCPPSKDDECEESDDNKEEEGEQQQQFDAKNRDKKQLARKHRMDREHYDKKGRLVTVQTLRTLHGVFHEGGGGGHHSEHHSGSRHHAGHHKAYHGGHKKQHGHQAKPQKQYKQYHPAPRPRVAVTG